MSGGSTGQREPISWGNIAELVGAAATIVGSIVAIIMAFLAYWAWDDAREAAADQRSHEREVLEASQMPLLMFDRASNVINIANTGQKMAWDLPRNSDGTMLKQHEQHPMIRNYGPGVAVACSVEIRVTHVNLKEHSEVITATCSPVNVPPNGETSIYIIPQCIGFDAEKKVEHIKGTLTIRYQRLGGRKEETVQTFFAIPNYDGKQPTLYFHPEPIQLLDHGGWASKTPKQEDLASL